MSEGTNIHRGRIAFPELGDGVSIHFNLDRLAQVENHFDKLEWWDSAIVACESASTKHVIRLAEIGTGKPRKEWPDDLTDTISVAEIGERLLNAMAWAAFGKSYGDWLAEKERQIAELQKRLKEAEAEGN